ncbi:TetR/AcrR family transcriptional regulator [Mycobacterium kiyosense]|uniref:TetR family transcriptional regulator n=1 Tax=Mycobacterium kiyosense TaxID=2871094 RepID=A0A9P3UZ36_9MYCO|nr:TetR/AcrR family transcriptional regulator [Mycobacterium kiyosense]GLB81414.1 TetR family transcriptional regulator [Mycobacterium kiyosense]GLB97173.1 TetR family transcriptional regulator [Mycobacterium kiyosense]GLD32309.1 TetR family transcriptional regulator [Mycobacterium kiyosense]GLD37243.1 TetR family transcriptional regulator [Mycobacterium kiyosense]
MTTRQEQAQRRREQLIEAALNVFARKGVDGTSIKDIAQAAGVAPGLLYHYFDSKEVLVAAVLAERGFLPQLRELLIEHADQPATTVLPRLIRAFDETLSANADLVSVFFSASHADAALRDFVATGKDVLASYLTSRAKAGELRPELIGAAADALFAAVAIGHKTGHRVNADELVELVLRGLATQSPSEVHHVVPV